MNFLGIDPGLSGGWACVSEHGALLQAHPMPTIQRNKKTLLDGTRLAEQLDLLASVHPLVAHVELVSSRPRQAGQFQFGVNTGVIHGILYALGVPLHLTPPVVWKSAFGLKRLEEQTKADMKTAARVMASEIWPDHAHLFRRVKDDGVAEASLIALYAQQVYRK